MPKHPLEKMKSEEIKKLLRLEKERRGIDTDKLVFIGMANLAQYWWCAMGSLLKNKQMELNFFSVYLNDRLEYAKKLGYITKWPKGKKLLEVGDEITLSDVNKLLEKRAREFEKMNLEGSYIEEITKVDKKGNEVTIINPAFLPKEKQKRQAYMGLAKDMGFRIAEPGEFPKEEGEMLQSSKAENYPTIRWNFDWENFVVVGVPDGMTKEFVYEFKTTGLRFLLYYAKPVAFVQGDLYGYFFQRPEKRIQIYIKDENKVETFQGKTDEKKAVKTLEEFKKATEGEKLHPPKKWKCKNCEFKDQCKLSPS